MTSEFKEHKDSKAEGDGEGGWTHIDFQDLEIGERIGGGGVGIIYKGWIKETNRSVALKTLFDSRVDEKLKKEYMDELLVMSKLNHINIVEFLGACMTPPNLCFVMELCETSLYSILHRERVPISSLRAGQIALDISYAMEYLHCLRPSICHRDLKSLNVLQAFDGRMKLCDFGLVSVRSTAAGTPAYMAPELLENKTFNKSVDVYSFGVLLWEIYSQSIPFYMISFDDLRAKVVTGERPEIPTYGCPARAVDLIRRCWSQYAEDRPDFSTVVDELTEIVDTTPESKYSEDLKSGSGDALDDLLTK